MSRAPLLLWAVLLAAAAYAVARWHRLTTEKQALEQQVAGLTARALQTAGELDRANGQNQTLRTQLATANTELIGLKETLAATQAHAGTLERELSKVTATVTLYEQTDRAMTAELAGVKAELADVRATFASPEAVAAYQGTIAELERELANARHGAAAPSTAGASTAVFANRAGRATVLSVGPSNAFVVLDYGSDRGAQVGQQLAVSQGTAVVATVLISDVRPHFAIAQVQPDTVRAVLQKGDLAVLIR
jgi:hypothetical protein